MSIYLCIWIFFCNFAPKFVNVYERTFYIVTRRNKHARSGNP